MFSVGKLQKRKKSINRYKKFVQKNNDFVEVTKNLATEIQIWK